jgi:hypothetical protein
MWDVYFRRLEMSCRPLVWAWKGAGGGETEEALGGWD